MEIISASQDSLFIKNNLQNLYFIVKNLQMSNKSVIFASKNQTKQSIMNKFTIYILTHNRNVVVSFEAAKMNVANDGDFFFSRLNEYDSYDTTHGAILFNTKDNKICLSYDIFDVNARIIDAKKVGDNFRLGCATDFGTFIVYIVRTDELQGSFESVFEG